MSNIIEWINSITESFTNNLIVEDRYRMILDGLQVTLLITLCAALLGTLLGGLVCWMRMSRRTWLQQVAKVYIELMRGTPVLVLLMLMYYVVMAPLDATGVMVAIVTFAMNTSAYISEMLRTTIQSIDRGQTEAGLALGFTQRQTFFKIVLPQVVKAVMPVYQGEVVSLLKGTSIVGCCGRHDTSLRPDTFAHIRRLLSAHRDGHHLFPHGMAHRDDAPEPRSAKAHEGYRCCYDADIVWHDGLHINDADGHRYGHYCRCCGPVKRSARLPGA